MPGETEIFIKYLFDRWVEEQEKVKLKKVRYSGINFGKEEYRAMLDAIFGNWWSGGKYTLATERKLAEVSQRNHALLVNSGSSANLALMTAAKELYFEDDDKILTLACGFPTTANVIVQAGLQPVFSDIDMDTLSVPLDYFSHIAKSIKGAFLPHTLGFFTNINELLDIARANDVLVFFDCCDAYGSEYVNKPLQHYGKAATLSFYAAHHISCGEGGAVVTNDERLFTIMRGMRNWGRYCSSTECCVRAENPNAFCPETKYTKDADLPEDYMVNYQFEWMGYNLKMLEIQAAILSVQIDKIKEYNERRIINYNSLYEQLKECGYFTVWHLTAGVSPFSVPLMVNENAPFKRKHFMDYLRRNGIESRMVFAGNLLKHPAYAKFKYEELPNSNRMLDNGMMLGCSHVIGSVELCYMTEKIADFLKQYR